MFVDWRYVYARITYGSTYGSFNKGFKYLKQEVIQSNSIRMNQISDSIDLAKRTISDKTLKDKVYEIARNPNGYQTSDRYQTRLASMVYTFFDNTRAQRASANEELAQKLHKPEKIKKFKRRRVYAKFKYNIWAADVAEIRSLYSKNSRS